MATEIKTESSMKLFFVNIFVSILPDAIYWSLLAQKHSTINLFDNYLFRFTLRQKRFIQAFWF